MKNYLYNYNNNNRKILMLFILISFGKFNINNVQYCNNTITSSCVNSGMQRSCAFNNYNREGCAYERIPVKNI